VQVKHYVLALDAIHAVNGRGGKSHSGQLLNGRVRLDFLLNLLDCGPGILVGIGIV